MGSADAAIAPGAQPRIAAAAIAAPGNGVTVVYSPCAGVTDEVTLTLRTGATVADAVRASGLQQRHLSVDFAGVPVGVWGVLCSPHRVLREADRVELYRPLTVDPKEARRRRQRIQRDAVRRPR